MLFSLLDFLALCCFVFCWSGYTYFARKKAKTTDCIARSLHQHRIHWMKELMNRDIRVGDAALLANLERNIAFFASTTLIIIAGVLALFAQIERLKLIIASLPFALNANHFTIQIKLSLLAFIFVLAFFQFTWSMRQYGFVNVMIGAAPIDLTAHKKHLQKYAVEMAVVQDQAAHSYNYGLRSYYFSLAAICWFFHPVLFILASMFVSYTLYRREFKSKAVRAMTRAKEYLKQELNEM